jgi:arginase family enzyme
MSELSLRQFVLSSIQAATVDAQEEVHRLKDLQKLYKKMQHRIIQAKDEDAIKLFLGADHEIFAAYEKFLKGDFSENRSPE